ncbi:flagellar filament capping protein FliD [Microbacterium sediminis]|nr:flagellar filament capping protein FliD [Microbacterium sediminis]
MPSISFPGLASGLDTAAMVDALMEVQAIPRILLQQKADDRGVIVSNLQALNSQLQTLTTRAGDLTSATALAAFTSTASSDAVSVTARPGAQASSLDVVVDRVAKAHTVVSAGYAQWPTEPATLTIVDGAGELHEITAQGTSLTEIAAAINDAGVPVTATTVRGGTDANGDPIYRLQLVANSTGAASAFQVFRGTAAEVTAGTATDLATEAGAAVTQQGQDAAIRLYAGTAAEQTITSARNTFTDLLPDVDVTVRTAQAEPVSLSVTVDTAASAKTVKTFIDEISAVLNRIDTGSKATVAEGETTVLGVYTGDSTVRGLRNALANAVIAPIDGVSPSSIGISVDRYGELTFDEEAFADAMAADPARVEAFFAGIAGRVEEVGTTYSDRYEGFLTTRITGQQSEVRSLDRQIESMDVRLEKRRATLEAQFLRMETMMAQWNAQSTYLSQQIASLPTYSKGNES